MSERRPSSRRRYLRGVGTALGIGLAGCSAEPGGTTGETPGTDEGTAGTTAEPTATADEPTARTDSSTAEQATTDRGSTPVHAGYETTEVRVTSEGETLGSVTAAIADTQELRYRGLSDTESLPEDRGMLFVYESVDERTFVMRRMDFGIDIVYADADGTITRIHHAPEPGPNEDGEDQRYPGRGQYVLEINYEWTTDHGVEEGDVLEFEL
ncbi:DUF192 domain-containing protein [Halorarum halophilum]|uniref:DUF192 domain-containing protein n=1 Tax=Halorarum halophilum TaxID=2743090 RepID=A0A7D5KUM7_9EURY|nr:DUF192 domain-containing protein [Halobaculum halophilum]QLG27700.1 DUF192 domain-containing protein [Halobaculum halophilum]